LAPAITSGDVFNLSLEDLVLGFGAQMPSNVGGGITVSKKLTADKNSYI
jgi:hypothetical protein